MFALLIFVSSWEGSSELSKGRSWGGEQQPPRTPSHSRGGWEKTRMKAEAEATPPSSPPTCPRGDSQSASVFPRARARCWRARAFTPFRLPRRARREASRHPCARARALPRTPSARAFPPRPAQHAAAHKQTGLSQVSPPKLARGHVRESGGQRG